MLKFYKYCIRFYDGINVTAIHYYNNLNDFFNDLNYDLSNIKYNEISILVGAFKVSKNNNK